MFTQEKRRSYKIDRNVIKSEAALYESSSHQTK
jgi:hypothetical protein